MKQYDDEFEERWINLVKYDERIQSAIAQLQPYGDAAIDELKQAFQAIDDFTQLPNITKRIAQEKEAERVLQEKLAEPFLQEIHDKQTALIIKPNVHYVVQKRRFPPAPHDNKKSQNSYSNFLHRYCYRRYFNDCFGRN